MFACCGSKKKSKVTATTVDETQDYTKSQSYSSPHLRHPHKAKSLTQSSCMYTWVITEVSKTNADTLINTFKTDMNRDRSQEHLSPLLMDKKELFSKQSPHFGSVGLTKTSPVKAVTFSEKTKLHCSFCGGKSCKHEDWKKCKQPLAIEGLHSNWIGTHIIGAQRLSDRLIKEFDIMRQFKQKGVTAVFNLQEPGEHPYCGDGIIPSTGFSYTPELLMNNGISYFNFYWEDLTAPTFTKLLNTVQVMDFVIRQGGKVLVHCHAGQGRTAILIGAYLIYSGLAKDDKEAIMQTREGRHKCFSKAYNRSFMKTFMDDLNNHSCNPFNH